MEKNIKSTFLEDQELLAALEAFVRFGILRETTKNGQRAWIENKEFNKKSKEEQDKVFAQINFGADILEKIIDFQKS